MSDNPLSMGGLPEAVRQALVRSPARVLTGRAGSGYRTSTALRLREDHAAARDAVHAEVHLELFAEIPLVCAATRAKSRREYLMRPDLGRSLDDASRTAVRQQCPAGRDLQIVVGDGLAATAVNAQAPPLHDALYKEAESRGWSFGLAVFVRNCRVGVMNEIGELLAPAVVVLLIGERPGLAIADSLSAYLAYRPHPGHTDADRNVISNIQARGVGISDAARRIASLASTMMRVHSSGVNVKEEHGRLT